MFNVKFKFLFMNPQVKNVSLDIFTNYNTANSNIQNWFSGTGEIQY